MIYLGKKEHLDDALPLLRRFQEDFSPWKDFSEARVRESFDKMIFEGPFPSLFLIADNDEGEMGGFLIAISVPSLFSEEIQTQELGFFVIPEERKSRMARNLIKTYEYWSKNVVKADVCSLGLMDDRVGKLYNRMGYEKAETSYIKRNF